VVVVHRDGDGGEGFQGSIRARRGGDAGRALEDGRRRSRRAASGAGGERLPPPRTATGGELLAPGGARLPPLPVERLVLRARILGERIREQEYLCHFALLSN
jgi:hypothetical protein